jgi:hypothetical protein
MQRAVIPQNLGKACSPTMSGDLHTALDFSKDVTLNHYINKKG